MSEDHLPAIINPPVPAQLRRELELAEGYAQSALAPSTRKAYEHDWLLFAGWCAERSKRTRRTASSARRTGRGGRRRGFESQLPGTVAAPNTWTGVGGGEAAPRAQV